MSKTVPPPTNSDAVRSLRTRNAELLLSEEDHAMPELLLSEGRHTATRAELLDSFGLLEMANVDIVAQRRAALNLLEDAVRSRDALRESEGRFRTLFESAPMAVFSCDLDAVIQNYNSHAVRLWGREPECGIERHCGSIKLWLPDGTYLPHTESPLLEVLRTGDPVTNVEVDIERPDGSRLPVLVNFAAIRDAEGQISGAITSFIDITERKRSEMALRASEERRKLAEEAGNVGIFDSDVTADETYWSEAMWEIYGEKQGELNPDERFWTDHIHGTDRERVTTNIRQAVSSGSDNFTDEFRIVRPDGTIRWIEAKARISRDQEGAATRVYGINLDITHRKEAEERIMRSESQLRMVTDTVPALISYVDSDEKYRFVNKKYLDWFGKPREEIIGRSIAKIVGDQAYRMIKPHVKQALEGRENTFETELVLKGTGTRFVRVSYSPDVGIDGHINGFYALISDMTDLKRSRDLLRSSEERIGLIMESLTDYAIFSTDSEGRVESWNRGAESIYGYKTEEILGLSCEILFEPQDVARGVPIKEMRTARKAGRAIDERWHVRKDGSRFFCAGVLMPLYMGEALTGYARVASDLTEKQRRADELQRAHDELEARVAERTTELAEANIALREEMAEREIAEAQRIDLLRRLVSSQESERRRIARDIHDTLGQRLTALRLKIASLRQDADGHHQFAARVERLQEISERLDHEVSFLAWELRPSALDDLGLAEALGAYVSEWSRHHEMAADFHSEPLPHEPLNRETETHLYRITQEALNNIAKHSGANNVSVVLKRRESDVILIIEDNGRGFDQTKSVIRSESGQGLGLLGMSERANLVGGEVEIESAPGKGTTIFARVPFHLGPS